MKLSQFVKIERMKRGWDQKTMAKEMGVSVPIISYIENGRKIGIKTMKKISSILNTDLKYIVKLSYAEHNPEVLQQIEQERKEKMEENDE